MSLLDHQVSAADCLTCRIPGEDGEVLRNHLPRAATHRRDRAKVDALVEELGIDLGRGSVDEPVAIVGIDQETVFTANVCKVADLLLPFLCARPVSSVFQ